MISLITKYSMAKSKINYIFALKGLHNLRTFHFIGAFYLVSYLLLITLFLISVAYKDANLYILFVPNLRGFV